MALGWAPHTPPPGSEAGRGSMHSPSPVGSVLGQREGWEAGTGQNWGKGCARGVREGFSEEGAFVLGFQVCVGVCH